jgi:cohesin complex subunit SA-1/2
LFRWVSLEREGDNDDDASQISKEREEEEESDEDDEMDDSDEYAEKPPPSRKKGSPSPRKKSPAKKSTTKSKASVSFKIASPQKSSEVAGSVRNCRQAVAALNMLAKKGLDKGETSESSLAAALLLSVRAPSKGRTKKAATDNKDSWTLPGVQTVATSFLEEFYDDGRVADVHLVNLILRCVGGSTPFDEDMDLEEMSQDDWTVKIADTVEEMDERSWDQVMLTTNVAKASAGAIEFRHLYTQFWYQFATLALTWPSASGNADDRFNVEWVRDRLARLSELSIVGVPDIRLATVIAIYQMGRAMLDHTKGLRVKLATAKRQLSAASRNKQARKAQALNEQVDSWNRIVDDLEYNVKEIIMPVFSIRFRDSNASIRVVSLEAMTAFGSSRPDIFAVSFYLKYCGWMMSDKDARVRMAAIRGLISPVKNNVDSKQLTGVIMKFLERLGECVLDIEVQVQEVAMNGLLTLIREAYLNDLENDRLWLQINLRALSPDTSPTVRRDALYFVMEQMGEFDDGPAHSEQEIATQLSTIGAWYVHDAKISLGRCDLCILCF